MSSRAALLAAAVLIAVAILTGLALLPGGGSGSGVGEVIVVAETPGLKALYEEIACPSVSHRYVVLAAGGDPHFAQLTPSQARLVKEADIVVVVPGSPAGMSALEAARAAGARIVAVTELPLEWAYLKDNRVYHAPWYDPVNAEILLRALAEAEASAVPSCRGEVEARLSNALAELESVAKEGGALEGSTVVADLPFNIYLARWLGANEVIVVRLSHEAEPPPSVKERVREALARGAVVLVTVDERGEPVDSAGRWLLGEARGAGVRVALVPAPWLEMSVADALANVARQLADTG